MDRLVLDTSIFVEIERRGELPAGAIDLARDDVAVSAITVAELLVGVAAAEGKARDRRAAHLDAHLEALEVLPYDVDTVAAHADLIVASRRAGRPPDAHDLIIAATARVAGRTVVTLDRTGFDDLPGVSVRQAERAA